jgi:methyl-accepting chemotaxis protein
LICVQALGSNVSSAATQQPQGIQELAAAIEEITFLADELQSALGACDNNHSRTQSAGFPR